MCHVFLDNQLDYVRFSTGSSCNRLAREIMCIIIHCAHRKTLSFHRNAKNPDARMLLCYVQHQPCPPCSGVISSLINVVRASQSITLVAATPYWGGRLAVFLPMFYVVWLGDIILGFTTF